MSIDQLLDYALKHVRTLMFPEEWIELDLALSKSELLALLMLDRNEEIMMSEIAEHIQVPMSTATGIINRLVKHGFIERGHGVLDRRVVVIRLSEQGRVLVNKFKARLTEYLQVIEGALTDEEKNQLITIVMKIMKEVSAKSSQAAQPTVHEESRIRKIQIE